MNVYLPVRDAPGTRTFRRSKSGKRKANETANAAATTAVSPPTPAATTGPGLMSRAWHSAPAAAPYTSPAGTTEADTATVRTFDYCQSLLGKAKRPSLSRDPGAFQLNAGIMIVSFLYLFRVQKKLRSDLYDLENLVRCRVLIDGGKRLRAGPPSGRGHVLCR